MTDYLNEYVVKQAQFCIDNTKISPRLYDEYGVKLGLRNEKGVGVLTGLTGISKIVSSKAVDGQKVPCEGELWYRGYRIENLIASIDEQEYGFEKIAYLLLMGKMPSENELRDFFMAIGNSRTLPTNFTRDVIMKAPSEDIMNSMTRSILTYSYGRT